ncbi:MAG: ATP-dependent DNA ligase [Deltaproteobacteria bacterium]|nr:ATP-dependent DNA ligase [Deltaproteobacteria bacterium]
MSPRFVVHRHDASRLHWDLRLEREGVLKSWAVPKEPPVGPGVKRLAVEVEDHDLDHIDFEGEIPEGEYGAGTVSIWDGGTYDLLSEHDRRLKLALRGKRLRGEYVLVPLEGKNWLFFRTKGKGE